MVNIVVFGPVERHKQMESFYRALYITREDLGTTVQPIEKVDEAVELFKARLSLSAFGAFIERMVSSGDEITISKAGNAIEIELK